MGRAHFRARGESSGKDRKDHPRLRVQLHQKRLPLQSLRLQELRMLK
jgi:hypothetical protein